MLHRYGHFMDFTDHLSIQWSFSGLSFVSFDSSNQIKYMPMVYCVSAGVFLRDLCGLLGFQCSQNTHSPAMMVTSLASPFNEE